MEVPLDAEDPRVRGVQPAGELDSARDDHLLPRVGVVPDQVDAEADMLRPLVDRRAVVCELGVEEPVVGCGPPRVARKGVDDAVLAGMQVDHVDFGRGPMRRLLLGEAGIAGVPAVGAPALDVVVVRVVPHGGVVGQTPDAEVPDIGLFGVEGRELHARAFAAQRRRQNERDHGKVPHGSPPL